jgi:Putative prokaryotic signal transducing protein
MLSIARRRRFVTLAAEYATSLPEDEVMRELLRTNDPVLLGYVEVLLADQGIAAVIFDGHISLMEGSIGAFPRRLLVDTAHWDRATRVMRDADLGSWVRSDEPA